VNIQLKQRLVGAVVLVSLGVIFIPMILPGDGDLSAPTLGDKAPPAPDYRFSPLPEPPAAPALDAAAPVVEAPAQEAPIEASIDALVAKAVPEQAPPAEIKPDNQAKAWVVQVGSFSSDGNANALRDKLRKQGFVSFVEAIKGDNAVSYRVRVGPELSREKAEQLQQRLKAATKLNGIVLSYS